jgi:protein arginine N-methyltransferase 1
MEDPPQVDVVVSETLGNYPFEEHIIETLNDARRRFLKPKGVIVPRRLEQYVAPVTSQRMHTELTAWDDTGFDLGAAKAMSLNNIYVRCLAPKELLQDGASAQVWDAVDFAVTNTSSRKGGATWRLAAPATVYGFATWWTAELVPGVKLSTAPGAARTHWEQLYFPVLSPLAAKGGQTIAIELRSRTAMESGTDVAWTATLLDGKGGTLARQALNLDKGYLP